MVNIFSAHVSLVTLTAKLLGSVVVSTYFSQEVEFLKKKKKEKRRKQN